MRDFWINSGFNNLTRNEDGYLLISDDFLRRYYQRPELQPVPESCDKERNLYNALMNDPQRDVSEAEIKGLADPDASENYQVIIDFRNRLLEMGTLENAYLSLVGGMPLSIPSFFIDMLVQPILRNILDASPDAMNARAGELFFREQMVNITEGAILLGDRESVESLATGDKGLGNLGRYLGEAGIKTRSIDLDVLNKENSDLYWERSERFDTVIELTFPRPGLIAVCKMMSLWVAHFLRIDVTIEPVQKITDEKWVWHTGLDTESSALLNDLYNNTEVEDERMERLLSLFRLDFRNPTVMRPDLAGRPVYLAVCMTESKRLRFKPQNLLLNLPLAHPLSSAPVN